MLLPLYCQRKVLNWKVLTNFFTQQGVQVVPDLHVTIAYSTKPVDLGAFRPITSELFLPMAKRDITVLGKYHVLLLESKVLNEEFNSFIKKGCSWDFPNYNPHISIFENPNPEMFMLKPFEGAIVLGPQEISEIEE